MAKRGGLIMALKKDVRQSERGVKDAERKKKEKKAKT